MCICIYVYVCIYRHIYIYMYRCSCIQCGLLVLLYTNRCIYVSNIFVRHIPCKPVTLILLYALPKKSRIIPCTRLLPQFSHTMAAVELRKWIPRGMSYSLGPSALSCTRPIPLDCNTPTKRFHKSSFMYTARALGKVCGRT